MTRASATSPNRSCTRSQETQTRSIRNVWPGEINHLGLGLRSMT